MMLRFNGIFLTLVIPLCLACYSLVNNAYLMSNNSCTDAHSLYYRHQQDGQLDEHNINNKVESRPECYLLAWELEQPQAATWLKNG